MNYKLLTAGALLGLALNGCYAGATPTPIRSININATPTPSAGAPAVSDPVTTQGQIAGAPFQITGISASDLATLGLTQAPTLTLPVSVAGNGTATLTNTPPTGVATFSSSGPQVLGKRSTQSATITSASTLFYLTLAPTSNVSVTAPATYSISFTPTNVASATNYHAAFFNGSSWIPDTADIGTVSNGTVTINGNITQSATLSAGTVYAVAIYAIPSSLDSLTGTLSTSGAVNVGPTVSTYTGTIFGASTNLTLPPASNSAVINYTLSQTVPTGVTAPTGSGVDTVWGYAVATPTSTVTFPSGSSVSASMTIPSGTLSGTYSLALSPDGINWTLGVGSITTNGTAGNLSFTSSASFTASAGTPYYIALYN